MDKADLMINIFVLTNCKLIEHVISRRVEGSSENMFKDIENIYLLWHCQFEACPFLLIS